MILTVGNTKGGVGKSTLALHLAIARATDGRRVWLVDSDRQGTAVAALSFREAAGRLPHIRASWITDGKPLHQAVTRQRGGFDDVVIDAGGRDATALRAALVLSDVLLIPFAPRSLDLWALRDMAALVDDARAHNPALRALAVLNGADPAGADNDEAAGALAQYPQLEYLPTPLRRRKAFASAAGLGMSVAEMRPRDPKAVAEMEALAGRFFIAA